MGDAHVLVLGAGGGGVLALLAASAGARRVTVIERHPLALGAARRLVSANAELVEELGCHIELVPVPLERCWLREGLPAAAGHDAKGCGDGHERGEQGGLGAAQGRSSHMAAHFWVDGPPADLVVTDLWAHPRWVSKGRSGLP
jgi:glycine/D-amino acid oxidase-like deaminating enzyme